MGPIKQLLRFISWMWFGAMLSGLGYAMLSEQVSTSEIHPKLDKSLTSKVANGQT